MNKKICFLWQKFLLFFGGTFFFFEYVFLGRKLLFPNNKNFKIEYVILDVFLVYRYALVLSGWYYPSILPDWFHA